MKLTQTGAILQVEYQEPTTNKDGSALDDLDHTSFYYDMGNGPVKAFDAPAASPNGGGQVIQSVEVPVTEDHQASVTFWSTAWDSSGNESPHSNEVVIRIDRLAPGAPL